MKSKMTIVLAACFFFMSFISATTILKIQTLPDHEIYITELDAYSDGNVAVAQPLRTFTGKYGKLELEYTPKKVQFRLGLLLKNGSKTVMKYNPFEEAFDEETTIELTFIPNGMEVEDILASVEEEVVEEVSEDVNETEVEVNDTEIANLTTGDELELIVSEEESETSPGIFKSAIMQGSAVLHNNKPIVSVVSYSLIAVILAFPIFMFVKKRKGKIADQFSKVGDLLPKSGKKDDDEDDFEKAEEDLKKAKERIEELKGKKVSAARQKLIDDEKELMRLRKLGKD